MNVPVKTRCVLRTTRCAFGLECSHGSREWAVLEPGARSPAEVGEPTGWACLHPSLLPGEEGFPPSSLRLPPPSHHHPSSGGDSPSLIRPLALHLQSLTICSACFGWRDNPHIHPPYSPRPPQPLRETRGEKGGLLFSSLASPSIHPDEVKTVYRPESDTHQ